MNGCRRCGSASGVGGVVLIVGCVVTSCRLQMV